MRTLKIFGESLSRTILRSVLAFTLFLFVSQSAMATGWNGIEPLKSRRADVERVLGKPILDQPGQDGTLHFNVAGGKVTVLFINARFVASKKLSPELEGTVLQIVLQHENSSNTPESMGLPGKSDFEREDVQTGTIFRNQKEGLIYTFVDSKLKTTRYMPSARELGRARAG